MRVLTRHRDNLRLTISFPRFAAQLLIGADRVPLSLFFFSAFSRPFQNFRGTREPWLSRWRRRALGSSFSKGGKARAFPLESSLESAGTTSAANRTTAERSDSCNYRVAGRKDTTVRRCGFHGYFGAQTSPRQITLSPRRETHLRAAY